jgi:spoIIIJ-associated protein
MSEQSHQALITFINTAIKYMGVACEVAVAGGSDGTPITVTIQAPEDARMLIGKDGQNLRAFEHIIRTFCARNAIASRSVVVDVNDYRRARAAELVSSIHAVAQRVRETRRSEALDPMTSYERRVVHTELAAYHDLLSESIGQEPQRRVVIKPL